MDKYGGYVQGTGAIAVALTVIATGLVVKWASPKTMHDEFYLNTVTYTLKHDGNFPAYHPVLAVGGFYMGQVLAISCWTLIPHHYHATAKALHGLLHSAALVCICFALKYVVAYELYNKMASLNTMHSWIGVMAFSTFAINYLFGIFMAILTFLHPGMTVSTKQHLRKLHRFIGLCALCLSTVAILSGVNNQLPQGTCNYTTSLEYADTNPASHYTSMPASCKVAYGTGIAVTLCTLTVLLMVTLRGEFRTVDSTHEQVATKEIELPST